MTPFEKGEDLLTKLVEASDDHGVELPSPRYVLLGEPVIDCAGVIIALTGIATPEEFDLRCGAPQIGTFIVAITRACAAVYDAHGNTIPKEASKVSKIQAIDSDLLWAFASGISPYVTKTWDIGYAVTGAIAITSLSLRTGID